MQTSDVTVFREPPPTELRSVLALNSSFSEFKTTFSHMMLYVSPVYVKQSLGRIIESSYMFPAEQLMLSQKFTTVEKLPYS